MLKLTISLLFLLFIVPTQAQDLDPSWIKANATITDIHKNIGRRGRTHAFADVTFTGKKGDIYSTRVELLAIPIYGAISSIGDEIVIYYNPDTPQIARSKNISFFNTYGMYVLIAIGVLYSGVRLFKLRKKSVA
ncbi:DUF3592 domain-containing protein [Cellulophaga baltica]|uniref:DUF3592 domain-containing protein n=1 Tax=Cellulophaga TaxID=104264 RepID=UPI001C07A309|nr:MULTISPECIES: DUF3592 domain-containing protein [Cellulophaga]MBU2998080.1 DUF3592 domain-containing protein [Cellulophaga baltica]MDO6769482.1 DUF3592 domain-containing protein [Cellulophaga sp. 1_MG-2023]